MDYSKVKFSLLDSVPQSWLSNKTMQLWEDSPLFVIARRAETFDSNETRMQVALAAVKMNLTDFYVKLTALIAIKKVCAPLIKKSIICQRCP